jgi:CPA1 family monovalent cation:H+ antiporter
LQGVSLPPLIRVLGLAGTAGPNCEEQEARRIVIEAAVSYIEDAKARNGAGPEDLYDDLASHYRQRLATLRPSDESRDRITNHEHYIELSLQTLRIERDTAIGLRNEGRINDEVLRRIERELDLSEARLAVGED